MGTADLHIHSTTPTTRPTQYAPYLNMLQIGKLGSIAFAPHPFNNLPGSLSMEAVIGALTNPRAKAVLKGIETHNMGTQAFDGIAQKLSIYLPLAKIASSDAHVYRAIGAGRTEFPARTILSWARHMALRRFGYASDSSSASQPINTQKFTRTFIRKINKKIKINFLT